MALGWTGRWAPLSCCTRCGDIGRGARDGAPHHQHQLMTLRAGIGPLDQASVCASHRGQPPCWPCRARAAARHRIVGGRRRCVRVDILHMHGIWHGDQSQQRTPGTSISSKNQASIDRFSQPRPLMNTKTSQGKRQGTTAAGAPRATDRLEHPQQQEGAPVPA